MITRSGAPFPWSIGAQVLAPATVTIARPPANATPWGAAEPMLMRVTCSLSGSIRTIEPSAPSAVHTDPPPNAMAFADRPTLIV